MITIIRKRDGRLDEFNIDKIALAINKAFIATNSQYDLIMAKKLALDVYERLEQMQTSIPTVELVQDTVEEILIEKGLARVAKAYIIYRLERTRKRDMNSKLMLSFKDFYSEEVSPSKNKLTPNETIYQYGVIGSKIYNEMFVLDTRYEEAMENGEIYINHPEYYSLAPESLHVDIADLIKRGNFKAYVFKNMSDYFLLINSVLKFAQQQQYGEVEFMNFDTYMEETIKTSFNRTYKYYLNVAIELSTNMEYVDYFMNTIDRLGLIPSISQNNFDWDSNHDLYRFFINYKVDNYSLIKKILSYSYNKALEKTKADLVHCIQRMMTYIKSLNLEEESRPTICYGLNTSKEARLFDQIVLDFNDANPEYKDLCHQIFLVQKGVNEDIYEVFKHHGYGYYFQFIDVNNRIYHANGASFLINQRGNAATTIINLAHIAYESNGDLDEFYCELDKIFDLVVDQLKDKYDLLISQNKDTVPLATLEFYAGNVTYEDILNDCTLSVGFIGLNECVNALNGKKELSYSIVKHLESKIPDDPKYNLTAIYSNEVAASLREIDANRYEDVPENYTLGFGYHSVSKLEDIKLASEYYQLVEGGYMLDVDMTLFDCDELFNTLETNKIEFVKILNKLN